ncbi:hypothetical protein, partial [Nonomuraea longispora]|uniref:hypothetical protein n=1 Tax=Nonomuraea longispora TaxID=1848320 RepID=UPI0014047065
FGVLVTEFGGARPCLRSSFCYERDGGWQDEAARTAYELAGEAREPSTEPGAETCAAYHYAGWIMAGGSREPARTMLRTIAEGAGPHAAQAAAVLGEAAP